MADILELTPLTYVVVLGGAVANFSIGMLDPTISLYLQGLGLPSDRIGQIIAGRFTLVALFSIPLAILASRVGLTKFLFISGAASILAGSLLFMDSSANGVYVFYLIVGISQTINSGPGMAIIAENKGTRRVAAYALFSTTWMIPPALGAGVSYLWFKQYSTETVEVYKSIFYPVFLVLVVGGVLYTIVLVTALSRGHGVSDQTDTSLPVGAQFRTLFRSDLVVAILIFTTVQFLMGGGAGATLPYLSIYLNSLGGTADQISLLSLVLNLSMGVATQLSAPLAKRFGDLRVFFVCTTLSVISLLGIVFSNELGLAATFYILRGTFANMTAPITQSRVIGYIEESVRATGSAWMSTWRWIGWTILSPYSGRVIDSFGFEVSFVYTAMIYALATTIFILTVIRVPDLESRSKSID